MKAFLIVDTMGQNQWPLHIYGNCILVNACPFVRPTLHDFSINIAQKSTIHQVTTMLVTSKNALFPGHNHPVLMTWHLGYRPSASEGDN